VKPAVFEYFAPTTVAEAVALLGEHADEAKVLAGGQSLVPLMNMRLAKPGVLVDVNLLRELDYVRVDDGYLAVGAVTRQRTLERSPLVAEQVPLIRETLQLLGHAQIRNRGTVGGNVAHADPASDLPTVLTALDARFELVGEAGVTTRTPATFFQGMMATAVGEHDLVTAIEVPLKTAGQGMAYVKFDHPASRYAVIGAAAILTTASGRCTAASVAVGGLVPKPVRASSVEQALVGQALTPETMAAAAVLVATDLGSDILGDIYASARYRQAVVPVYVKRALVAAASRVS
jgi:carbon-monoxide dehydrogenase medium subunit